MTARVVDWFQTPLSLLMLITFSTSLTAAEARPTSRLRTKIENPITVPLYTIHMGAEFNSTWVFGAQGQPPIPAGFFGLGSDAWSGPISCVGEPYDPGSDTPTADMAVNHERLIWIPNPEKRYGPPEIPEKFQLRVDMVKLSEKVTKPITVTYNGGANSEQWDAKVQLGKDHPGGGIIDIVYVNSDSSGGLMDIEIAVKVDFVFKKQGTDTVRVLTSGVEWLAETNAPFSRRISKELSEKYYVTPEMDGGFVPALQNVDGRVMAKACSSKNSSVIHSFVLPPTMREIVGDKAAEALGADDRLLQDLARRKWGTVSSLRSFPERKD